MFDKNIEDDEEFTLDDMPLKVEEPKLTFE